MYTDKRENSSEVVNIVVAGSLGTGEVDVEALVEDMIIESSSVSPGQAHISRNSDSPTLMLYRSGKYVIAGAKSENDIDSLIDWLIAELHRLNVGTDSEVIRSSKELRYMVVKYEFGQTLDLSRLMLELGMENAEYEPEQFPGLIYRDPERQCTILIFSTGRIMVTGVRSRSEAQVAYEHLCSKLSNDLV